MSHAFSRAWTDAFGSAYLTFEGGTGNINVLVVCSLEDARAALDKLEVFVGTPFKGRVTLCTLEHRHVALVKYALETVAASALIAVEPIEGVASSGPALRLEPGTFTTETGATYTEGGTLDAWRSKLLQPSDLETPSLAASLAVHAGLPALACGVEMLPRALERTFTAITQRVQ